MAALTRSSQVAAVTATTVQFTTAMVTGQSYALISTVACWFTIGATGNDAVAGAADNVFLPADVYVEIKCEDSTNGFVNAIRVSADGTANLVLLEG